MAPGGFEHDSFELLTARGWDLQRVRQAEIAAQLPAFNAEHYVDGYFNRFSGWSPSGRVVGLLLQRAVQAGVGVEPDCQAVELMVRDGRVAGILDVRGRRHQADLVVVAAGAWTTALVPELEGRLACIGQPVLHFLADDADSFRPPGFPVWTSDIGTTGWYGFPATKDGVIKVGNHGPGRPMRARGGEPVGGQDVERCRAFLKDCLPSLASAPVVAERLCLYCDTFDHGFWIDHHPEREGLFVAAGGSGHGFKFAPVLGEIIADVVERRPNPWSARFAWRDPGDPVFESCRRLS